MSVRRSLAGALVAVALLAFAGPLAARQVCVPFKAVGITTSEVQEPNTPPGTIVLHVTGEGRGTHLGKMTSTGTIVITLQELFPGVWVPVWFEGDLVMVAANGDELHLTTSGDPITGEGTYTIDGGTGRFDGATGSGSFKKDAAAGVGTFDGKICFPRGK